MTRTIVGRRPMGLCRFIIPGVCVRARARYPRSVRRKYGQQVSSLGETLFRIEFIIIKYIKTASVREKPYRARPYVYIGRARCTTLCAYNWIWIEARNRRGRFRGSASAPYARGVGDARRTRDAGLNIL